MGVCSSGGKARNIMKLLVSLFTLCLVAATANAEAKAINGYEQEFDHGFSHEYSHDYNFQNGHSGYYYGKGYGFGKRSAEAAPNAQNFYGYGKRSAEAAPNAQRINGYEH